MLVPRDERRTHFHWVDYLIFALTLAISLAVGVYYGIKDKRQKRNTIEDFLFAGRKMNIFPVAFSLFVSWMSAIAFLGDPVEVYYNGAIYWVICIGSCIALLPVAFYFAPKFEQMKLCSAYEFLEARYNPALRIIGSVIQGILEGLYCGVVLYAPSLALAQVSGVTVWVSIVGCGLICTVYTTLGGIKAVLWADTIQMGIMFVGLVAVVIRGCVVVGGLGEVWSIAEARGRINFNNFTPNPFVRVTFWSNLLGGFFWIFNPYIFKQKFIQRYCSVSSAKEAKQAVLLNIPIVIVFSTLFVFMGLVMVAYYDGCDPLLEGRIEKPDQIVPLVMVELLSFIPGFPGLFLASLFCASLSSMSSVQNSLAINLLKDIVEPIYEKKMEKKLSSKMCLRLSKIFSVMFGIIIVGLGLVLLTLKDASVFEITLQITGSFSGPMAALFFLGLLVPFANSWGCIVATLMGSGVCIWWNLGSIFSNVQHRTLPVNIDNCPWNNISMTNDTRLQSTGLTTAPQIYTCSTLAESNEGQFSVNTLYQLSPILFNGLGFFITVLVSIVIGGLSFLLCKKEGTEPTVTLPKDKELNNEKLLDLPEVKTSDEGQETHVTKM